MRLPLPYINPFEVNSNNRLVNESSITVVILLLIAQHIKGLFSKVSDKELLKVRNELFVEHGIPALEKNGFVKSPFSTAWFGKNNLGDYTYQLCRISDSGSLEIVKTHISKGDNWVKIFLNDY